MYDYIDSHDMNNIYDTMEEQQLVSVSLMMEHAGLNLAKVVVQYFNTLNFNSIVIIVGEDNIGVGGLVAARRLGSWGYKCKVYLHNGEPKTQILNENLTRAKFVNCEVIEPGELTITKDTLVVDAYSSQRFTGEFTEEEKRMFSLLRESKVISLDIPAGMDSSSGITEGYLNPLATVALAWPKYMMAEVHKEYFGKLFLVDIGIPYYIFSEMTNPEMNSYIKEIYEYFKSSSLVECEYGGEGWTIVNEFMQK